MSVVLDRVEVERDLDYEHEMTQLAAMAAEVPDWAQSIIDYAEPRAWPGGIKPRTIAGWRMECAQELADCRSYCCFCLTVIRPWFEKGEAWACDEYVRLTSCLVGVMLAWAGLHTQPS